MKGRTFEAFQQEVINKIYPGSVSVPASLQRILTAPASAGGIRQLSLTHPTGKKLVMFGTTKCGDRGSVCG